MDQSKLAVRYAKAFFELAKEKGQLDELRHDMGQIRKLCDENADFKMMIESPVIKTSLKMKLMDAVLEGKVSKLTQNFIRLITHNKRESNLVSICRNFVSLYNRDKGIRTVVLTSAVPLSDSLVDKIRSLLEQELNSPVELSRKVEPGLIGGFVLRIDDKQVDTSISARLKRIKTILLQSDIK